jgi:peptidyl-prolyl cis-trans isomerase B (cyclophilin B)
MTSRSRSILIVVLALAFLALVGLAGCGSDAQPVQPQAAQGGAGDTGAQAADESQTAQEQSAPMEEGELYQPTYKPNGDEKAVIKTSKGDITIVLFGKDAPIHVGNFVELAQKGFYNDTKFHRYVEGFVVQGGDPDTREASAQDVQAEAAKGDGGGRFGVGGPGYMIEGEFDPQKNPNKHELGSVGMARSMDPNSAGSQFYFALQPLPQLDGQYTVFAKVSEGLDVMEKLRAGDVIESVKILNASK